MYSNQDNFYYLLDLFGSQIELARQLNLHQSHISAWASGRAIPKKHARAMALYINKINNRLSGNKIPTLEDYNVYSYKYKNLDTSASGDLSLVNLVNLAKQQNVPIKVSVYLNVKNSGGDEIEGTELNSHLLGTEESVSH